ncbi:hypothetical protein J7L01_05485, partial [bacterium]|nr:hypothetical protein [bacterium]
TLHYKNPSAKEVFVAGSFNDWSESATPMESDGEGNWSATLDLAPGRYEYKFVVDGVTSKTPTIRKALPIHMAEATPSSRSARTAGSSRGKQRPSGHRTHPPTAASISVADTSASRRAAGTATATAAFGSESRVIAWRPISA